MILVFETNFDCHPWSSVSVPSILFDCECHAYYLCAFFNCHPLFVYHPLTQVRSYLECRLCPRLRVSSYLYMSFEFFKSAIYYFYCLRSTFVSLRVPSLSSTHIMIHHPDATDFSRLGRLSKNRSSINDQREVAAVGRSKSFSSFWKKRNMSLYNIIFLLWSVASANKRWFENDKVVSE